MRVKKLAHFFLSSLIRYKIDIDKRLNHSFKLKTKQIMKKTITILSLAMITACGSLYAQDTTVRHDMKNHDMKKVSTDKGNSMMPDIKEWPEASRMAVEEITGKYLVE